MVISTDYLKSRLGGLAVYLPYVGDSTAQTDLLTEAAEAAQAEFQRQTRVLLETTKIVMNPSDDMKAGTDYDLVEDAHPYHRVNSRRTLRVFSWWKPIQVIHNLRLEFDRKNMMFSSPPEWLRVNKHLGQISIVPYAVAGTYGSTAGMAVGMTLMGNFSYMSDTIDCIVAFDYDAGVADCDTSPAWADVRQHLGWHAAASVARSLPDLVPNSVNTDGFSQAFDTVSAQLEARGKEWDKFIAMFQRRESGLISGVL